MALEDPGLEKDAFGGYYAAAPGPELDIVLLHIGIHTANGYNNITPWLREDIPSDAESLGITLWDDEWGDGKTLYDTFRYDIRDMPYDAFRKYIGGGDGYTGLYVTCPHCSYRHYVFSNMIRNHFNNCEKRNESNVVGAE